MEIKGDINMNSLQDNGKLIRAELQKDYANLMHHLRLTYEYKDQIGNAHRLTMNKVPIPLIDHPILTQEFNAPNYFRYCLSDVYVDCGFGKVLLPRNATMTDEIVHYAEKEMTLEEVEKALGHKVKIVNRD